MALSITYHNKKNDISSHYVVCIEQNKAKNKSIVLTERAINQTSLVQKSVVQSACKNDKILFDAIEK